MPEPKGDIVVADTTPIISLSCIGYLKLLRQLYSTIFIPQFVHKEIIAGGERYIGVEELRKADWIKVKAITNLSAKEYLMLELEEGEAETIVLAEELRANLVILDDLLSRKIAKLRGLKITGTLGVLISAKKENYISKVRPLMDDLIDWGIWIGQDVYDLVLT